MKKLDLKKLMDITASYSRKEGANEEMEGRLRSVQSGKDNIPAEEIVEIDRDTLSTVAFEWMPAHCAPKFVSNVLADYGE